MIVRPDRNSDATVDLKTLVDRLGQRGLNLPVLIRFNGILRDRLRYLNECFAKAIDDHNYQNRYRCVFPIKVNQQREVVQQIAKENAVLGFGIEAGSKPELLAAVAMSDASVPIICNGFKDEEFIRLALMAQRMGRTVMPVIEKASELDLILRVAAEVGVRPTVGMRVKLATRGSGRWQASGGYRSKFGLTVAELLTALDRLVSLDMADCFQLLHFHVGSQIGNIRQLKSAILEAARIYVDLKRRGAAMGYLDVGGGLGVDYDGSRSDNESSMNYTIQEYANDVVFHIQSVCDEAQVPHPQLLSESGRAIAAQHSVLVVETIGVTTQGKANPVTSQSLPEDFEKPVHDLKSAHANLSLDNVMESFHDAQVSLDLCMNLFSGGYLPLEQRVEAENLYFSLCHRIREISENVDGISPELKQLDRLLSDIYFVNFSLFQSLPDSWAIGQMFPVMPIHRLDEAPTRSGVLGDITCDSDGKVDHFIGGKGHQRTLKLHTVKESEPYQLGIFFVGAYQEILGDLHNLFGDTHAVHVDCENGEPKISSIVKGDTVSEVLSYVQYDVRELIERIQGQIEDAISAKNIDNVQAGQIIAAYEQAMTGYTYLRPQQAPEKNSQSPAQTRVTIATD
ncbi:Biosynthetic arginine decarboxylase [Planctomycetes bacterium K23_9]|uniref:Arginine decarboxylase n=1 Tax=Stieleria marina TaxID=1930275 RepID=A0A517P2Q8_9BACT|nr:Biosynthetic arginine decarboxylase [Planctomycetes bacterium K23_9]